MTFKGVSQLSQNIKKLACIYYVLLKKPFNFRHFISDKKSRIIVTTNAGSSNEVGVQLYSGACRGVVFGGGITLDLTAPGVTPDLTAPPYFEVPRIIEKCT